MGEDRRPTLHTTMDRRATGSPRTGLMAAGPQGGETTAASADPSCGAMRAGRAARPPTGTSAGASARIAITIVSAGSSLPNACDKGGLSIAEGPFFVRICAASSGGCNAETRDAARLPRVDKMACPFVFDGRFLDKDRNKSAEMLSDIGRSRWNGRSPESRRCLGRRRAPGPRSGSAGRGSTRRMS